MKIKVICAILLSYNTVVDAQNEAGHADPIPFTEKAIVIVPDHIGYVAQWVTVPSYAGFKVAMCVGNGESRVIKCFYVNVKDGKTVIRPVTAAEENL